MFMMSVVILLLALHYIVVVLGFTNYLLIFISVIALATIVGLVITSMAVAPLKEHFKKLERFSKETLHELNLPINTIMANTKMLTRSHSDEKSQKRIQRIEAACNMLKERYNELDYMIKKQMRKERVESFDLAELITERVLILQSLYASAEFTLNLESLVIEMDRIGFQKVIDNIIDNAVKYSEGSALVEIELSGTTLSIKDSGVGMDEVALLKIFDRYYQEDNSMPGFGIGLGLVKAYCDQYHIRLSVHSKKDHGTTIILNLQG